MQALVKCAMKKERNDYHVKILKGELCKAVSEDWVG